MVGSSIPRATTGATVAYTIFYMGINLGAFLSPLICGPLGERIGWGFGFMAAGIGMTLGLLTFVFTQRLLMGAGLPPGQAVTSDATAPTARLDRDWRFSPLASPPWCLAPASLALPPAALVARLADEFGRFILVQVRDPGWRAGSLPLRD